MRHLAHVKKLAIGLSAGSLLALTIAGAGAIDTVTQQVTPGALTASIADLNMAAVAYSHTQQAQSGTMVLTVDDSTGSDAGWNVTVQASDFIFDDVVANGADIPASGFTLQSAGQPVVSVGQAVDPSNGPMVPVTSPDGLSLDAARKVVQANAGYGKGEYTQDLGVELQIPAQALAGTYTSTLTVTESSAP